MIELEDFNLKVFEDVTNDVFEELDSRQENIEIYYPYFEITRKLKAKQEENKIDLHGIFIATLSFLLYVGKLNGRKIQYEDIFQFIKYFISKISEGKFSGEEIKKITDLILDETQNKGINFTYSYYSFKKQKVRERHIKYIEIKIGEDGEFYYYITPEGVDFYLKTKEFPDAAQVTINLLLFKKQIEKGSFDYAYSTLKRLNIEVKRKIDQKEVVLEGLMYGGKEAIDKYYKYHEQVNSQFAEEQELFQEVSQTVKNLYTEYLQKENVSTLSDKEKNTISIVRKIERELTKTTNVHTKLLKEVVDMPEKYDEIIKTKMRSAFSEKFKFEEEFKKLITNTNNPEKLKYFIMPFLLPKNIKRFNPMKSIEPQKLAKEAKEIDIERNEKLIEYDNIDKITEKRVINNFRFYFKNILLMLKENASIELMRTYRIY